MDFEIKNVREGIFLLTCLGEYDAAHHFALSEDSELKNIKKKINEAFSKIEEGRGKNRIHKKYINDLKEILVNEADIQWAKKSHQASLFLWMWLACVSEQCQKDNKKFHPGITRELTSTLQEMEFGLFSRTEWPIKTPHTDKQYYLSSLYALDLSSGSYSEKRHLVNAISDEYKKSIPEIDRDFSWLSNATENQLHWVLNQFMKERSMNSFLHYLDQTNEDNLHLLPYIYYFWGKDDAEKKLWLIRLKKNYANMKHREKVKDKAPVNIRISPSAKNKLIRLEKKFNRSRSEVIEHLIEQAWADK
ncbi:TPA: hypothetical protein I8Y10_002784 [Kluyvera cryocrescens]|nr:hypothetical protein [Kluyvera cryocrescens]